MAVWQDQLMKMSGKRQEKLPCHQAAYPFILLSTSLDLQSSLMMSNLDLPSL